MSQHVSMTRRQRRRFLARVALRVIATTTVVLGLYYLLPMDDLGDFPIVLTLAVGLALLVAMGAWEIRNIMDAKLPTIRATQSLAGYVPLFLVLFATCYYLMSRDDPSNFNIEPLTKTDTLYFTVTVFSTVGFGDINATSEIARIVVMVQIVLDLVLLGVGVRLLTQAVQVGQTRRQDEQDPPALTQSE